MWKFSRDLYFAIFLFPNYLQSFEFSSTLSCDLHFRGVKRYFCGLFMFFLSCVCYAFVCICLFVPCGHLWERADLLALVCSVKLSVNFVPFPLVRILGQVWYLIVSIPDLYTLTYFKTRHANCSHCLFEHTRQITGTYLNQ